MPSEELGEFERIRRFLAPLAGPGGLGLVDDAALRDCAPGKRLVVPILIDGTDPFGGPKPDARLIRLLIRASRLNAALVRSDGASFAALAEREGVSRSYFTRLVRLSYLAPDIKQAILDGRQPRDLTADKLLAPPRLPLAWNEQLTLLGFA